uniref:PID domain-containing protein n=1 Tax=Ditylenchus dipsaci TaxID=166011 RepID=A0A915DKW5_9BILA
MATSSNGSIGEVVSDLPAASTSSPVIEDASSRSTDLPAPKSQQQPLFSNPFMAPFLPQTAQLHPFSEIHLRGRGVHMTDPATIPLQSQGGSDEIAIGEAICTRLMLAAHGQEQNALSEGDKKSRATSLNSELNDAFGMGPTIHSQQSTSSSSLLSSFTVDPEKVASSIALLDVQSSVSEHKIDSAVPLTILSETTSPQPLPENKSEHRSSTSPPSQGTVQQMCPVSNMTEVVETVRQEMESTSLPEEHPVIEWAAQDEAQAKAVEEPEIVEQEDQKAATVAKKAAPSSHNHMQHDQRTSELIKKQINEIEREISRRIQNKNVKKMDEAELAQLLSDHGFGNFVGFANTPLLADQSAIPYRPSASSTSEDISESTKASLNQLRSSFSPPPHHLEGEPTGSGGGPLTMPQTTPPPPPPPHQHYFAGGATNGGVPSPFGQLYHPTQHHQVQQMPAVASPFYGAALQQHLPQHQQFYQQQHPSRFGGMVNNNGAGQPSSTPPIMSNISAEMAAALLQQLQQQNPGLIQNLVEQQHQMQYNNSGGAAAQNTPGPAMIPAPPLPINNVSRKTNGAQQQQPPNNLNRKLSAGSTTSSTTSKSTVRSVGNARGTLDENGWFDISKRHGKTSNGAGEDKENGTDPVWVMRDSYLKRLQREEQRDKELISSEKEEGDEEKSARHANAGDQEEEDGKVSVAGVLPTTKKSSTNKKEVMVHEPAVLIEGVLFRARYLGSTQLVCDGRPTNCRTSRMAQAQEAVARVKAPDGEIQPSTEIDLFISTEKIMRISETDVRQDILMDHSLRSISYIADIGDLVV